MARTKNTNLNAVAEKLAMATQKYLKTLSASQRKSRVEALNALAERASTKIRRNRAGSSSITGGTLRMPAFPVAAKAR